MALLKVKYVGNKFWQFNCIYGLQTVGSFLVRTFKLKFGMSLHLQQLLIQIYVIKCKAFMKILFFGVNIVSVEFQNNLNKTTIYNTINDSFKY